MGFRSFNIYRMPVIFIIFGLLCSLPVCASDPPKARIKALAIPLADHYAGIVAYEKYRETMRFADYQIQILAGPDLVRAYFYSESDADVAFNVCPMVMDMFIEKPDFRWVGLIHRDGNALTINKELRQKVELAADKRERKPDGGIASAFAEFKKETGRPVVCAIPSPLATHATILYKYLKDHNIRLSLRDDGKAEVVARVVKPPLSPGFLKRKAARGQPAAFEQSLPWGEVAEIEVSGEIGWYSKDVMGHPHGHVECVIIAKDEVIRNKRQALQEVIYYIHRAGWDIERARRKGGEAMVEVVNMIRKHIPSHSVDAIKESLRPDLEVITYSHLNIDSSAKWSLREIMKLAVEAGFLRREIDIDEMTDETFSIDIGSD